MATSSGAAAVVSAFPLAPPPATTDTMSTTGTPSLTTAPTATSAKNLEQLMKEIDETKTLVDTATKKLDKIEFGRKRTVASRDEAIAGRTELQGLKTRITDLQTQVNATAKASDPIPRTFEKRQKNANNSLKDLVKKIDNADKRLEKGIGSMPAAPATTVNALAATNPAIGTPAPAAGATAPAEAENTKGIRSFVDKIPLLKRKTPSKESLNATSPPTTAPIPPAGDTTKKPVKDTAAVSEEDYGSEDDEDDDDVVSEKKPEPKKVPPPVKTGGPPQIESDDSDETDDDDDDDDDDVADDAEDQRQLLTALEGTKEGNKDSIPDGRRSQTPSTARSGKQVPPVKLDSARTPSPKPKKATITASPLPPTRKKTPSPKRRVPVPAPREEESEDSYGDEDEEDDEEELRRLGGTGEHEEAESDHDYGEEDEGESAAVNVRTQELRGNTYPPGTQFVVTQDFTGAQTGDLTIQRGETLTLIEQRPDDWWLLKSNQTQQQGVVPINHIHLLPRAPRLRAKPSTSATNLVDAFKANSSIPVGFTASDLAPMTELEEYKVSRALVPRMTDSNLAFADLHWRVNNDRLYVHDVTYQKILTIKECVKIPRAKGDQIRVLDRCVRVCLYDGYEIVSNIHTIRAHMNKKLDDRDLTEDWTFLPNDTRTLTDEQSQILLRSNRTSSDQHLNLLIELSQWCQSTVTQEKCEVACGWTIVPLQDDKPPLISDTKSYNELLHGGHTAEKDVLLDPQYKILRSDGLSGMIDRFKRARVKFSIESRETDVDLIYDTLPTQPIVVPLNLIKSLYFYRSELAYQLHKRQHPTGLSTTPIDSLFLSTFFQTLSQPDLIYILRQQYNIRKRRVLNSSSSPQQQREEFIHTYEKFIYPLLQYRQLPSYDFHDIPALNERRKLILEIVKRQTPNKKTPAEDILSILLDPKLTDKWTPFTTDETCFSLQKYTSYFSPDLVA